MNGSGLVDVAIGMAFLFLVFSLVVSGINEAITRALAWRSRHLWSALRELLDGGTDTSRGDERPNLTQTVSAASPLTEQLRAHPLVHQLEGKARKAVTALDPHSRISRIPPTDFSRALLDVLVEGDPAIHTVGDAVAAIEALPEGDLRTQLLTLASEANGQLDKLRGAVGEWFDGRMEALSRTYKSRVKWFLVVIGLIVAGVLNVDAVGAATTFYRDAALRAAVVQQATNLVDSCDEDKEVADCLKREVEKTDGALRLPVGWPDPDGIQAFQVFGWILAGIAIGQGAPFWFDLLRKASRLRS
jgi:hypothetical protein